MLSRLVAALQHINPDLTAKDIADAIWLARYMGVSQAAAPSDSDGVFSETKGSASLTHTTDSPLELANSEESLQDSQEATSNLYLDAHEESGEGSQQLGVLPFRSPAVVALPDALDIARALRPFMHRVPLLTQFLLNEEATAERSAEEGRWVPVLDYAQTRWLDVALVIDKGASMAIWQQTIMEFHLLLARQGAFRDVRVWELDTNDRESVYLYAGTGMGLSNRQPRNELELIDASQRRLILVVTDCISPAWRSGIAAKTLEKWGHYHPVTLVQVLPQPLWSRTALKRAIPVYLHATSPGIPNREFKKREASYWDADESQSDIPIPVVTLEPKPLANWARVIARAEDTWISGFKLATSPKEESVSPALSAAERVQRFRANASPLAYRLAGLLTTVPISLPIIRLIQRTMLPASDSVHLAEVFLGGILKVASANSDTLDPDRVQYDFVDGVRELLARSVPTGDTSRVLARITDFIEEHFGNALDFRALLANPLATKGLSISKESIPFAQVAAKILRPLGGDYVSLANWLEEATNKAPVQEQPAGPTAGVGIGRSDGVGGQARVRVRGEGVVSSVRGVVGDRVAGDSASVSRITKNFFISYHNADHSWAEWIAWQLEEDGYSVMLQAWDFRSGADFTREIDAITQVAEHIIIVLSPDYLNAFSTMPGWIEGFNQDPRSASEGGIWLGVQVRECISELEKLVGPVVYLDLVGLYEFEAREKLLSFVHRESTEAVVSSGLSSKFQRSVSKQPRFPGEMSILPKVLFGGPPRSGKSILPAILFGGPPHAGKSVLFYNLAKALRERGIPHYAIQACPDGEGNWFHELDQDKVRLIRVKGAWTDDFVKRICLDIERRHLPMLVDIDGRPTEKQTCLFRNCTHSLLLLRSDQEDNADFWRHLVKVNSLLPLAELYSGRSGISTIDSDGSVIEGTLVGLEHGSLVHGPLFDALVERITLLFTSHSPEELEKIKLDMAPAKLVVNLDTFVQAWAPQSRRWEREMIPRLLAKLPVDAPLAVYGPGPNWLYGALAAHAGRQPFYQFDPRIGWVAPPPLQMSTNITPEVQVELRTYEQVTVLSMRIVSGHLDYLQADHLPFPPVPTERGLILDGRIPHWLLTALVRLYTEADVAWIACRYIQLEGAVVVTSRTTDHVPGDFIALPVS